MANRPVIREVVDPPTVGTTRMLLNNLAALIRGQFSAPLQGGNQDVAYVDPPVQTSDTYEWIQTYLFPNMQVCNIDSIPPAYQNWGQIAVNSYGLSGLTGGGASNSPDVAQPDEASLFYDNQTGLYYDLPEGNVGQ